MAGDIVQGELTYNCIVSEKWENGELIEEEDSDEDQTDENDEEDEQEDEEEDEEDEDVEQIIDQAEKTDV